VEDIELWGFFCDLSIVRNAPRPLMWYPHEGDECNYVKYVISISFKRFLWMSSNNRSNKSLNLVLVLHFLPSLPNDATRRIYGSSIEKCLYFQISVLCVVHISNLYVLNVGPWLVSCDRYIDHLRVLVVRVAGYRSRVRGSDSWRYKFFWDVMGLERGSFSLVRITEVLLEYKSSGSGL
jgi:hypothetical protein